MRVLVIDDDELVRSSLSLALRTRGHDCTTAADALAGIELAESTPFDVAIIDINMPGIDGLEAIKAIAHIKPPMAIIAMSGRTGKNGQDYTVLATAVGAHAFMLKPLKQKDLLAVMERAVEKVRA